MNNILDALYTLRVAFLRADLSPPAANILASHEDGMLFLSAVKQDTTYSELRSPYCNPVEHPDGSVWMEVEAVGMKIRWPANRRAMETGGYRYE